MQKQQILLPINKKNTFGKNLFLVILLPFFLLMSSLTAKSELNLFNWRSYTSLMVINDFTVSPSMKIYAATSGGLMIYNMNSEKFSTVNTMNGLWDNNLTAVTYLQSSNTAITGSVSGALVFVDQDLKTTVLLDIQKSSYNNKSVNAFSVQGDILYISTGFGLVAYNLKENIFTETVLKFGNFSANISTNKSMIYNNKIYLATDEGIAFADISSQIADPKAWTTLSANNDLSKIAFKDIIEFEGKIYASSSNAIYQLVPDSLIKIVEDVNPIYNLTKNKSKIYYSSYFNLIDLDKNSFAVSPTFQMKYCRFFDISSAPEIFNADYPIIVYQDYGLAYFKGNELKNIMPNSPISNKFINLNIGNNGQLIAASGSTASRGIMLFDGQNWQNYYSEAYQDMATSSIKYAIQANDGLYYLSGYGRGLITLDNKGANPKFAQYSNLNSPLKGVYSEDWVIVGEVRQSRDGLIWMVNYGETSPGPVLAAMDKDKKFYAFDNCISSDYRYFFPLAIDGNNTKWLGSSASGGLLYFNENNTLENLSDDVCGSLLSSSYPNMPSNEITCIAVDKNDILWFGTPYGLASIYNPSAVIYNQKPIVRSIKLLLQQVINDIYVDAVDNKWIATNDGIWVLNSDASEILQIIDNTNSPLPTKLIKSVTGDENSGTIYFGTEFGLYAVSTLFVKPTAEYDINCYPQPFVISRDKEMVIDGLASNSEVFITTITGELIHRFSTFSKRIIWDGTDNFGNSVKSGIYLINAQSRTGNQAAVQKVAVINN